MENETQTASQTKLYVGSLPFSTTAENLEEMFKPFGRVTSAAIVSDQNTKRSKGFGFVEFDSDDNAKKAIAGMNGKEMDGRSILVREARPHTERGYQGDRPRERQVISTDNSEFTDVSGRSYGNRRGWW